mmetsp:Transcript_67165/g.108896  ORF Transcript_67165/g.108896 Transcript_67165/m.108896 type:complete len:122 (+) Transcript_67165:103-468(+)
MTAIFGQAFDMLTWQMYHDALRADPTDSDRTFPSRNTSLTQLVSHVLKGESVDSMSESSEEEESTKPTKRPWGFPKAHSMQAHVWATTLLYGDMDNVSALETRSSDPIHHVHTHTQTCLSL